MTASPEYEVVTWQVPREVGSDAHVFPLPADFKRCVQVMAMSGNTCYQLQAIPQPTQAQRFCYALVGDQLHFFDRGQIRFDKLELRYEKNPDVFTWPPRHDRRAAVLATRAKRSQ